MDDGTKRLLRLGNVVHDDLQKSLELHNRDILYKDIHNKDISIDSINIEKEKENEKETNIQRTRNIPGKRNRKQQSRT